VLAIFANCLNMGIILPFVGYGMYRVLAAGSPLLSTRRAVAAGIGAYAGITVAALAVGIELGIDRYSSRRTGTPSTARTASAKRSRRWSSPTPSGLDRRGLVTGLGVAYLSVATPST